VGEGDGREFTAVQALRTPQFAAIALAHFACCAAHSGPIFHMVTNAIDHGVSAMAAATVLSVAGLASLGGRIVCGEATYSCGPTFVEQAKWLKDKPDDPEVRLRAWGLDRALSGDIITEQNIHALDVATWVLDASPLHAVGTGGRKARTAGTCWDHFSVTFTFPGDVLLTFCSKQLGDGWDDICCRFYGTEGTLDTHYFDEVSIRGRLPYRGGKVSNLYADGAASNIATFHDSITRGDFSNPTVAASVRSTLTTILGRTAAWRSARVSWDEMMSANEELKADLTGLRS